MAKLNVGDKIICNSVEELCKTKYKLKKSGVKANSGFNWETKVWEIKILEVQEG